MLLSAAIRVVPMLRNFQLVARRPAGVSQPAQTSRLTAETEIASPAFTLSELMDDALTRAVMRSDGLTVDQFWKTVRDAQARL